MTDTDSQYMLQALSLASRGRGTTSPNPMVGAVVVRDGIVVGQGYHQEHGGPHAEVLALQDAGSQAKGATLYVTLEPCNHQGKTPPCSRAVLDAGIIRVVVAMKDPNPVAQGGLGFLEAQGVEVAWGVCEEQARKLNEYFIKHVTTGLPFVISKCAATLDGRIATRIGDSKWVTGEAAREYVHELRHAVDAILVGINTVRMDDPSLTTRLKDRPGKDPRRVILDAMLSMDPQAAMLRQESDSDTIIFCGSNANATRREELSRRGAVVVEAPEMGGYLNLDFICRHLGGMGVSSLLIEGGGHIHASAIQAGIVDKVYLFYAPKILGGDDGIPMFAGPGPDLMADSIQLKDVEVRRFDNDILVEGYVMDFLDPEE